MRRTIGRLYLWLGGWRRLGAPPPAQPKCVLVAAPHTSTWDLPAMLAFAWERGMSPRWMGKHTLFSGGRGAFLRWLGGIPIDRRSPHDVVSQMAGVFGRSERLMLAIPVEGTRAYRDYWKSGFYHIAMEAQVPIVLTVLDWGRKEGGFGPTIWPSGDLRRDMDQIRAFYAGRRGRWPGQGSRVRLRKEDAPPAPAPRRPPRSWPEGRLDDLKMCPEICCAPRSRRWGCAPVLAYVKYAPLRCSPRLALGALAMISGHIFS